MIALLQISLECVSERILKMASGLIWRS